MYNIEVVIVIVCSQNGQGLYISVLAIVHSLDWK